ncbi:MAG: ABC transporter permease subunit [Opitutae bacterium]
MIALSPITQRRFAKFRSIKRAWFSLIIIGTLCLLALLGPLLVGSRALIVKYDNHYRFPIVEGAISGYEFGLAQETEPNYRRLKIIFNQKASEDWVLLPLIPFSPTEVSEVYLPVKSKTEGKNKTYLYPDDSVILDSRIFILNPDGTRGSTWSVQNGKLDGEFRIRDQSGETLLLSKYINGVPEKTLTNHQEIPSKQLNSFIPYPSTPGLDGHILGTDESGHDVLARLFGGFQILLIASIIYMLASYAIGLILGAAMGYWAGWFDLVMQRFIEIWSNIPFLYVIVFLATLFEPNLFILVLILVAFSWIGIAHQMRAAAYREAARDYVAAARALGASDWRILTRHILPNSMSVIITMAPFSIAAVVASLSSLDYLGFGLPPTTPSWGDLLRQGKENWNAWWIITSTVTCMVSLLIMVNFIGEGLREAFHGKDSNS